MRIQHRGHHLSHTTDQIETVLTNAELACKVTLRRSFTEENEKEKKEIGRGQKKRAF
jgi:hypothetical protein